MTAPVVIDRSNCDPVTGRDLLGGLSSGSDDLSDLRVSELSGSLPIRDGHWWLDLVKVRPGLPQDGIVQGRSRDTERSRDRSDALAGSNTPARLDDDLIDQDGGVIGLPSLVALASAPSSGSLVGPVGGVGAVVDVRGIAARRVVAGVAADDGQVSVGQVEGNAVGGHDGVVVPAGRRPFELSVVLTLDIPAGLRPLPALVGESDSDLAPESGSQAPSGSFHISIGTDGGHYGVVSHGDNVTSRETSEVGALEQHRRGIAHCLSEFPLLRG